MYYNAKDFDYNIENLLNDYYKYIKESKTYKLDTKNTFVKANRLDRSPNSFPPFYPINENDQNQNNNNNINSPNNNNTNNNNSNNNNLQYIDKAETELLRALYTEINKTLLPYVIEVLDTFEYAGSPVYAKEGITREFLAQVIDLVLRRAVSENDPIDEIFIENLEQGYYTPWSRWLLLRAATESIVLNEIFGVRRSFR